MATVRSRTFTPGIGDEIETVLALVGQSSGSIFYVSTNGSDDNPGTSWESPFLTITYAISQCQPGRADAILIEPGIYDETGIPANIESVSILGVGPGVSIRNTSISNNGKVFTVTAAHVLISNVNIRKGETTSSGAIMVEIDGAEHTTLLNCHIDVYKAGYTGVKLTGGSHGAFISGLGNDESRIHGEFTGAPMGTGIDFDNCFQCTIGYLNLEDLVNGIVFRAEGDSNLLHPETIIARCTTGISLESGASDNSLPALIVECTTNYSDLSGNATNDRRESTTSYVTDIRHIPRFTGEIWFVDVTDGLDTNSGKKPEESFATIANAINNTSEGDAITVKAGDYFETNLDLNLIGLELWGEIGVTIYNTTGTGLTVSARSCRVREIVIITPGQTALKITGNYSVIEAVTTPGAAIGIDIDGEGNRLRDVIVGAPTTTGIDISSPYNFLERVLVSNPAVAARGFYLSTSSADQNTLEHCHSIGNTIAGFEVVTGANYNSFIECSSGGGDGKRIDNGDFNLWDIIEHLTTEPNEQLHPISDGQGTAGDPITVDNTATDDSPDSRSDQNYWGDTMAIILPDVLTEFWDSIGIYIFATTTGKVLQWQIWFPNAKFTSDRNGGNAWDYSETQLTVADASLFLAGDLIWIRSNSDPNGEILEIVSIAGNVITIASETRNSGNTGVRYDHAGNEAMYLIGRDTDDRFTGYEGGYAAGSAKDSFRSIWHHRKEVPANSAMIIRVLNTLDNLDTEFDVAAIYEL